MIEIKDINYSLNNKHILKDINVTVNDGEIIGIIGESGSGKTILLKILAGILKNYKGHIKINNNKLPSYSNKKIHRIISYLNNNFPNNLEDSLYNFLLLARISYKKLFKPFSGYDRQIIDEYINLLGLNEFMNEKIGQLPSGKLKLTLLAHTFIREANILLLDNPTTDLDISSIQQLGKILSMYVLNGNRIAIICSNDLNFIFQISDRILVMGKGKIVEQGSPEIIDPVLIKRYFNTDVMIAKNIYNRRPEIHLISES